MAKVSGFEKDKFFKELQRKSGEIDEAYNKPDKDEEKEIKVSLVTRTYTIKKDHATKIDYLAFITKRNKMDIVRDLFDRCLDEMLEENNVHVPKDMLEEDMFVKDSQ